MSKTLYIIGNGFDCAHSMPVCYGCFKNYLNSNKGTRSDCEICIYRTNEKCIRNECYMLSLLNTAIEDKENWSDFEEALARLDFTVLGDINSYQKFDKLIDNFSECLQEAFHSWINNIVIPPSESSQFVLDPTAYFVTFNYTMVLEQMYHIKPTDVYHIHCSTKGQGIYGEKYVFGHSVDKDQIKEYMRCRISHFNDNVFDEWCLALEHLRKDTFTIKRELQNKLQSANLGNPQIKIIGHSFGRVDFDYFEVIQKLYPNASWIYYYHDTRALCEAQNRINQFKRNNGNINVLYKPLSTIYIKNR